MSDGELPSESEREVLSWWEKRSGWWGEACFDLECVPSWSEGESAVLWKMRGECASWIVVALRRAGRLEEVESMAQQYEGLLHLHELLPEFSTP